ncbi:MAG: CpaF family protein [Actinomyces sp.]|nr:MAG: CpaF family protein [Actinomyces sp.]
MSNATPTATSGSAAVCGRSADPLVTIEQRVQERARRRPERAEIHELVAEEIRRWNEDARRGLVDIEITDPDTLTDRALRNLVGYGPLEPLLDDDDVWEIMINAPDAIFVKRHRGPSGYHHEVFHDDAHVERTLTKILDDADGAHRKLDPSQGLQDAQLPGGARLHIVHPDIARGGHHIVNIRKFTGIAISSLDELVERGSLGTAAAAFLRACVRARRTIVFAGAPGSGKTTLMNCCAAELDPTLRVVIAEEVFEADVPLPNVASMQTRAELPDRPAVDLRRLVAGFLRMAPDFAIVGEVRDREVLPLLLTLSSGVKGFTTVHAGSTHQALTRLRFVAQLADAGRDLPLSALNQLVSEAVDVVVHCVRTPQGPQVAEIAAVENLAAGPEATRFTLTPVFARRSAGAALTPTGQTPVRLRDDLAAVGLPLESILEPGGRR